MTEDEKASPALSQEQAIKAAGVAAALEAHYGSPQDVEWAIDEKGVLRILQSRPLKQISAPNEVEDEVHRMMPVHDYESSILIKAGLPACPGIASGPAFVLSSSVDTLQFPAGSVLVVHHALPKWATLLNRAAAVITDSGGLAGHLATVAREFGVPALFNTGVATQRIQTGQVVTVDAEAGRVYEGKLEPLLSLVSKEKTNLTKDSPVYEVLKNVMQYISPLNLTDPDAPDFRPSGCLTYHDITRFCHEMAVKEMFGFGKEHHFPERSSKRLVCHVPMQWWVIDLDDGFKAPPEGDTVELTNIASLPMLALWEGITAVSWEGPPAPDVKGLLSVMFRSTMDPSLNVGSRSRYAEKNYFMISKEYSHLSSRLGFHLSTVEAFVSLNRRANYINFKYKGGGADISRRIMRLRLIEEILTRFGFRVEIVEDCLSARLEGYEQDYMLERLKVLGYICVHTRQLDMVMAKGGSFNAYMERHFKDIATFVSP